MGEQRDLLRTLDGNARIGHVDRAAGFELFLAGNRFPRQIDEAIGFATLAVSQIRSHRPCSRSAIGIWHKAPLVR